MDFLCLHNYLKIQCLYREKGDDFEMAKSPKSKENLGYSISGLLDLENMNVIEETDDRDYTYDLESIFGRFNGCEVTITIKKTDQLESV